MSYDPKAMEARSVKLRRIARSEQLTIGLDAGEFWTPRAIHELAEEHGLGPVQDVQILRDRETSHEEIDRLFAALDEM